MRVQDPLQFIARSAGSGDRREQPATEARDSASEERGRAPFESVLAGIRSERKPATPKTASDPSGTPTVPQAEVATAAADAALDNDPENGSDNSDEIFPTDIAIADDEDKAPDTAAAEPAPANAVPADALLSLLLGNAAPTPAEPKPGPTTDAGQSGEMPSVDPLPDAAPTTATPAPAAADAAPATPGPRATRRAAEAADARTAPENTAVRPAASPAAPMAVDGAPAAVAAEVAASTARDGSGETGLPLDPGGFGAWRLDQASIGAVRAAHTDATASPPAVAAQLAVAIAQADGDTVELRLDPPELGKVQIRLEKQDDHLQVTVLAERPETQDFLRRHGEALVRELGGAGYGSVTLDFAGGQGREPQRDERVNLVVQGAEPERAGPAVTVAAGGGTVAAMPRSGLPGSLDIRL